MPSKLLLTLSAISIGVTLAAQNIEVSGTIISDETSTPVLDARVMAIESEISTSSDKYGNFKISIPANSRIKILKDGFLDYEFTAVTNIHGIIIRLNQVSIVSIGYQELPHHQLLSANGSVQSNRFNTGIINSSGQLIQGKVAGVQVTVGSGEPGSNVYIAIRGLSSTQISNPLVVLDGFPLSEDNMYSPSTDFGRGESILRDPLNFINPDDIERIDILKDASSSAMYGSRGSRGVILIKTKDGATEMNKLLFSSQFGISYQRKYFDLLNRQQFLDGISDRGGDPISQDFGDDTNWQKEINQVAYSQKYNLSYSSRYQSGNYRASVGVDNQPGIIKETGMKRFTGRLNWRQALFHNKLQITSRIAAASLLDDYALITKNAGFEGDLLGAAYIANPTWKNDPEIQQASFLLNPLSLIKYHDDHSNTKTMLLNLSVDYSLTEHINIGVNTGITKSNSVREAAMSPDLLISNGVYDKGRASINTRDGRNNLLEATAKYHKTLGQSQLDVLVGYGFQRFQQSGQIVEGWGFTTANMREMITDLNEAVSIIRNSITDRYEQFGYSDDSFFITQLYPSPNVIDLTSTKPSSPVRSATEDSFNNEDELQSFFGRVSYSYKSKYYLMASVRLDGSTLFGSNNRYGVFPSVSGSWQLSEEKFIPESLSELKLRLGIGRSGNQTIDHGAHTSTTYFSKPSIGVGGDIAIPSLNNTGNDNPDLKWEEMTEVNLGIDVGLRDNRIQGSIDFYTRTTTDILNYFVAPQPSPTPFQFMNIPGKIITRGIELTLDYTFLKRTNLKVAGQFNMAFNKNTLQDFDGTIDTGNVYGQGLTGSFVQRIQGNQPAYTYYLREFTGFDNTGVSTYNGDFQKIVNEDVSPKSVFGLAGILQYKNWDANMLFNGLLGHSIYNNTANAYFTSGSLANARNVTTDVLNNGEAPTNAPEVSTRFLEKGNFLRLQNLMVAYNFFFSKKPFKAVRTYITGQNLFVWTNYSGLDPDSMSGSIGIDYSTYPKARIFTLGVQATF